MTLRNASTTSTTASTTASTSAPRTAASARMTGPARSTTRARSAATAAPTPVHAEENALDEALDHIGQLAERLWAVRRLHVPARRRSVFPPGARVRCAGCGQDMPCPTLQAAAA